MFVYHAQRNGFRLAILNHLGALADVPLTSPRLYAYGELLITTSQLQFRPIRPVHV